MPCPIRPCCRPLVLLAALSLLLVALAAGSVPPEEPTGPMFAPPGLRATAITPLARPEALELDIRVGEVVLHRGQLDCRDNIPFMAAGYPILPTLVREFLIPDDARIEQVLVLGADSYALRYQPPRLQPYAKTPAGKRLLPMPKVSLTAPFPARIVEAAEAGPLTHYAYRLCRLVIHPAQYDPRTGQTTIFTRIRVAVTLTLCAPPTRQDPPFVRQALARYGSLSAALWQPGRRSGGAPGTDSLLVPASLASSAAALAVDWSGGQAQLRYQIAFWDDQPEATAAESDGHNPPVTYDQAVQVLAESGARHPRRLADKAALAGFMAGEWESSPGVILARPQLAANMAPLAGLLGWPLYLTDAAADRPAFPPAPTKGARQTVIAAGLSGGDIRVDSEQDANALLWVVQHQTGFLDAQGTPEDALVTGRVLNPPAAPEKTDVKAVNYLLLYAPADISQAAVTQLATYRAATSVNVSTYTPGRSLRESVVNSYAPTYLALVGDGDHNQVDQFYVQDTVSESGDPGYIPTDFFYQRNAVTYADGNSDGLIANTDIGWTDTGSYSWVPYTITGRVMCHDDASFLKYVTLLSDYENLNYTRSWNHLNKLAFFSLFCDDGSIATWDVHDTYCNWSDANPILHPIYHIPTRDDGHGGTETDPCYRDGDFTRATTFAEFTSGDNFYYFNTHGNHNLLVISYLGESALYDTEVASHDLSAHPAFMWLDTCLTCMTGNAPNVYYEQWPGLVDDDNCFGAQWLSSGAVGVLGCTMVSYGGYIDAVDRAFAYEMTNYTSQTLAQNVAWALPRYYHASNQDATAKKTVLEVQFLGDPQVRMWWKGFVNTSAPYVLINSGDEYATSTSVSLSITSSGATQMRLRNDPGTWTAWEPFSATRAWILAGGDGAKTVCVQTKLADGRISVQGHDGITLDTTPPFTPGVVINGGSEYSTSYWLSVALACPLDAVSMRLRPEGGSYGSWLPISTDPQTVLLPAGEGTRHVYAQCKDAAGNISSEGSDTIIVDTIAPSGLSISVNGGAACTPTGAVTLTLAATGASEMLIYNDPPPLFSVWQPFATSTDWTLYSGSGRKTVCFRCRDAAGNLSTTVSDTIGVPTFQDVPCSNSQWAYIEALVREGITSGCSTSPPLFCPGQAITRGQMAVFLCRAAGWTPYDNPTPSFTDVPKGSAYYGYVEEIVRRGVSSGCGYRLYCPSSPLTRGQMAVWLCRAAGIPIPSPLVQHFADVPPTHAQFAYIEAVYADRITGGCSTTPLNYCPAAEVTRGQMAVFLCRAFDLPL